MKQSASPSNSLCRKPIAFSVGGASVYKLLAPGLALAEEPNQNLLPKKVWMNRCQIITNGFLEAWQKVMALQRD